MPEASSKSREFSAFWRSHFDAAAPIGWSLRTDKSIPWIRLYSLEGGKRYPGNDEDLISATARFNAIGNELFEPTESLWICTSYQSLEDENEKSRYGLRPPSELGFRFAERQEFLDPDGDEVTYDHFVKSEQWVSGRFDQALALVAHDRMPPLLIISPTTHTIVAPYDGGVDIFLPIGDAVAALRAKFPGWWLDRTDGM